MKRFLLIFLSLLVVASSGCLRLRKPKANPAIATELEEAFKERWVQKRVGELIASGAATDGMQARRQALEEFKVRYEYTNAARKLDSPR